MKILQRLRLDSNGFTLVEIAIVVPFLIVIALALYNILYSMMLASNDERTQLGIVFDKQIAMDVIEEDSILASIYLPTNDSGYTDPYKPSSNGNTWSYLGESTANRALIIQSYSTDRNPLAVDRQPVYIGDPSSAACSGAQITYNDVLLYNVVYFVKNETLYRRRLVNTSTPVCNPGQYQKLSCPTLADLQSQGISTRNSACQADDEIIAKNVKNFTINYYSSKTATTPLSVYASGADPNLVSTAYDVEITLTIGRLVSGKTYTGTSTLRMSKLNNKKASL